MSGLGRPVTMPAMGDIPDGTPADLRALLEAIIATIDIREGRTASGRNLRFVTIQDLVDAGVIQDGDIE